MSNISLITPETAPLTVRQFFSSGDPGPIVSSLAHVPDLLKPTLPFIGAALGPMGLDLRTKEIVILRTSAIQHCQYCVATHTYVAHNAGLTSEEVKQLHSSKTPTAFTTEREKALLRWTDIVAKGSAPVGADEVERIRKEFNDAELTELTMLIGATLMLNRYATALNLPINDEHQTYINEKELGWTPSDLV